MLIYKVKGLDKLLDKLKPSMAAPAVDDNIKKTALKLEREAKIATVVDTGRLRSSITHQFKKAHAIVGTLVKYAPFIEYGTKNMAARHSEGGRKVLGEGMFTYAISKLGLTGIVKDIGRDVQKRWQR